MLMQYALDELERFGKTDRVTEHQEAINIAIIKMIQCYKAYVGDAPFEKLGEDDRNKIIGAFCRLVNHNPLTPLTGEESEWGNPVSYNNEMVRFNLRCPNVIKYEATGEAFHLNSRKFSYDRGETWIVTPFVDTKVTFPYRVTGKSKPVYLKAHDTPEQWVKREIKRGRCAG